MVLRPALRFTDLCPASSRSTRRRGSSESRDASTHPAVPNFPSFTGLFTLLKIWTHTSTDDDHIIYLLVHSVLADHASTDLVQIVYESSFLPRGPSESQHGDEHKHSEDSTRPNVP
jgi:hypothetical protein